jgi:hypothetical protein
MRYTKQCSNLDPFKPTSLEDLKIEDKYIYTMTM